MMQNDEQITRLTSRLAGLLARHGLTAATAESCTGGGIAAAITALPGSSAYFNGGVVAYANHVKENVLGVPAALIEQHGVVSEPVVRRMVQGVLALTGSSVAVATSGVAGPSGGTPQKPVGMVWMAAGSKEKIIAHCMNDGDFGRAQNVRNAIAEALQLLIKAVMQSDFEEK